MSTTTPSAEVQADTGVDYATYIASLIETQEARKSSLEQRGLAIITTSGTLATLLFGLVALLTKANDYELPRSAHPWITWALGAFVVAALLGVATNWPRRYHEAKFEDPKTLLDRWDDSSAAARKRITTTRLKVLKRAQEVNGQKAWSLVGGMAAEVTAILLLAIAIGEILKAV